MEKCRKPETLNLWKQSKHFLSFKIQVKVALNYDCKTLQVRHIIYLSWIRTPLRLIASKSPAIWLREHCEIFTFSETCDNLVSPTVELELIETVHDFVLAASTSQSPRDTLPEDFASTLTFFLARNWVETHSWFGQKQRTQCLSPCQHMKGSLAWGLLVTS